MNIALNTALARNRAVSVAALIVLTLLAWAWLFAGAGMGMTPFVSLAPMSGGEGHASGMAMGGSLFWSAGQFGLMFSMWWVMMVAMMLPSAAPMILLYARVAKNSRDEIQPATGSFLAGYLLAWGAFSAVATLLHIALEWSGLLVPMVMTSQSRILSAAILITAGMYQLSPLKDRCLSHCRSPAQFLSRHFRPGLTGALRMGLLHGAYCVGCCWLLMALLFVGGVMNLAWIALLTLMVAAEKLLPFGRSISTVTAVACIGWGGALLFV